MKPILKGELVQFCAACLSGKAKYSGTLGRGFATLWNSNFSLAKKTMKKREGKKNPAGRRGFQYFPFL
jgi:hypothetical protein